MTWANFDDGFADHPKGVSLSDGAFRVHVSGILYCSRYLTDGVVPHTQVKSLSPNYKAAHLQELLRRDLWHEGGKGCGTADCVKGARGEYVIHDYLEWNRSREQVTKERERKRAGGRKGAAARWKDKA